MLQHDLSILSKEYGTRSGGDGDHRCSSKGRFSGWSQGPLRVASGIHGTEIASIQFPASSRRDDVVNALAEVADLKPESPASEVMV